MRKLPLLAFFAAVSLTLAGTAGAAGSTWSYHRSPYTWLFGNHIDTHQELMLNTDGTLSGFFYVTRVLDDQNIPVTVGDAIPLYEHCTEATGYLNCQGGWSLTAYPCVYEINGCTAMFLYHKHDHPVWLIGPNIRTVDGDTFLDGDRNQVPQPGRPTHFHWLTRGSSFGNTKLPSTIADLEHLFKVKINVDDRCNVAEAGNLTPGVICPGYFLQLTARAVSSEPPTSAGPEWAFMHGGKALFLAPGPDMRTHINYVTSFPETVINGVAQPLPAVPTDSLPYSP